MLRRPLRRYAFVTLVGGGLLYAALLYGRGAQVVSASASLEDVASDRGAISRLLKDKGLKSVNFATSDGWAYQIQGDSQNLYIAGLRGEGKSIELTQVNVPQLTAAFRGETGKKAADLMIFTCGNKTFGENPCDYFSRLLEEARTGDKISKDDRAVYNSIMKSAVAALQKAPRRSSVTWRR